MQFDIPRFRNNLETLAREIVCYSIKLTKSLTYFCSGSLTKVFYQIVRHGYESVAKKLSERRSVDGRAVRALPFL